MKLNKLRRTKVKNQESLNSYHHSMECNFIVETIFNDKTNKSAEKIKTSPEDQKIKTLNKTDVKLLSIDIYVGKLLSNLAMNSFKPSSIANWNQVA